MADEALGRCAVTTMVMPACTANAAKFRSLPLQRAFVQLVGDVA